MAIVSVRQAGLGGFTKNRRLSYTFPSTMGMVLLSPTSIAFSGTSASIGANGQVTFTAVTSLSLNGVFSATYDNYVVSMRCVSNSGSPNVSLRWRSSGTDDSSANYAVQYLLVDGTGVSASRNTGSTNFVVGSVSTITSLVYASIYGPALAQPTASRSITVYPYLSASMNEAASTNSSSTSYDGFTLTPGGGTNITGALQVYGVRS